MMAPSQDPNADRITRRKSLAAIAGVGGLTLAGCTGGEGGGGSSGDGSSGDDSSGDGSSDDGSSGDGSSGDGGSEPDFPEFDPENVEFPQRADRLLDENLHLGTEADFNSWLEKDIDEPANGRDVWDPDEADEILEPDTLQFSLGRGEATEQEYIDQLEPMMNNIEEETGIPVEYQLQNSRTAQIEAFRSNRLHVGNTGAPILAVNTGRVTPYALPASTDEDGNRLIGYCWWIISQIDNTEMQEPEDLEGKTVAHASETSTSGHQAPKALMQDLFGVEAGEDYEIEFAGSHDAAIRGVVLGDYDASNAAATTFERLTRAGEIDPSEFRVLYRRVFPSGPMVYKYNLHPDIKEGIRRATFDYDYGEGITQHAIDGANMIELQPEDYKKVYDTILRVQAQLGTTYET